MTEQETDAEKQKLLEAKKIEAQLKSGLRLALDEQGYERLANISHANKELYVNVARNVLLAFRKIGRRITDDELVRIIMTIKGESEKETKITFHRK